MRSVAAHLVMKANGYKVESRRLVKSSYDQSYETVSPITVLYNVIVNNCGLWDHYLRPDPVASPLSPMISHVQCILPVRQGVPTSSILLADSH
jgi:hypothetical protein